MEIYAGISILLATLIGFAVSLVTLSGAWLILAVAGTFWAFDTDLFGWPVFVAAFLCALGGELFEFLGSAVGVKRLGGGRSGMIGSLIGLVVGLIVGQIVIPVPIVGSLVGGVVGAGIGALVAERGVSGKTWGKSAKIGVGAAAGRGLSMVAKSALTLLCGVLLTVAAFV